MAASFVSLLATVLLFFAASGAAIAQSYDSAYTTLDLEQCRKEAPIPDDPLESATWWCEGYGGIPVRVASGDLRYLISFGEGAESELAAGQTLTQFNQIGKTLEWRLTINPVDGSWYPVATILRYHTDKETGGQGQVLVVTKIGGPGQICHIGYVDALLNPDANAIARQVAESVAAAFICGQHQAAYYGVAPQ